MTKRPTYPKSDSNQTQIKNELSASGFPHAWCDVSSLPVKKAGVDVYVIGYSVRHSFVICLPVEIKRPGEKLTKSEQDFFAFVHGLGMAVDIPLKAESARDILEWFGRI